MNNVMLDLETLGTNSHAVIVSIGAVYFDESGLGDTFYRVLDLTKQQREGRVIDVSTIHWWMQQTPEAQSVFSENKVSVSEALRDFAVFVKPDVLMWGNGADFDNVVLGNLYGAWKIHRPWSYSKNRCYRTIKALANQKFLVNIPARQGTWHNALDDAIFQAECARRYLDVLRTPNPANREVLRVPDAGSAEARALCG